MKIIVNNEQELYDAVKNAECSEIVINEGVYELDKTLYLKSGTKLCGQGEVLLKGTKRVSVNEAEVSEGKYILNLNKLGISDTGEFGQGPYEDFWFTYDIPKPHMTEQGPSLEVYYDNKRMNMTRYPKNSFINRYRCVV